MICSLSTYVDSSVQVRVEIGPGPIAITTSEQLQWIVCAISCKLDYSTKTRSFIAKYMKKCIVSTYKQVDREEDCVDILVEVPCILLSNSKLVCLR